ncbi:MAG: glutamine-hydrolyzing carbamoyl-phosphate synthase small subunit [Patescibacteria group bacterium]|nr:glutamine-hydrolyzing carbamoyl-phosphate synthase small subunit [Patescibacteria group bacterium]
MLQAKLVLEDKSEFHGFSFGFPRSNQGEVVFNTGMTGYPESLTDPSYQGQILVATYPLIGNYGIPKENKKNHLSTVFESDRIHLNGFIVSNYSRKFNHWRKKESLSRFLKTQKIPGVCGIDTRSLTKKLRQKGVLLGRVLIGKDASMPAREAAKNIIDPNTRDLVAEVSTNQIETFGQGKKKIICLDCGMKNNIIHSLLKFDVTLKKVPSKYDFRKQSFDGLLISNGPGDPQTNKQLIENIRWALKKKKPIFGICLGNQIMALAAGAKTYKLKYGHRGQNQPCLEIGTNRCYLTSQNHGFTVNPKTLPKQWKVWFKNINDGTVEGIYHQSNRFFSVQFHPEACPGPQDTKWLFKKFIDKL